MAGDQIRTRHSAGVPVVVGPGGSQVLRAIPLVPTGQGAFDEAWLQRLVHDSPECLPLDEIEPGFGRLVPICREMPVRSGFVDNLLMTGAGDIAMVETKLFRNPEARRQVVAQAMDYATTLFSMGFEAFQAAALAGQFSGGPKPKSLHSMFPDGAERLDEAAFVDAVSRNLRRGRALVLVVGDGIREGAESLVEGLQAHAGFGFTLALVKLGVFGMPEQADHYLVRPRTLARTAIIQRTVVEVNGAGAAVVRTGDVAPSGAGTEGYWDALELKVPGARSALEKLIKDAEALGVYPEFLASLNLKWPRAGGKPLNVGYVMRSGALWTDAAAWFPESDIGLGYRDLARAYAEEVAVAFGCHVRMLPSGKSWTPWKDGHALRVGDVLDRLDGWLGPMGRFVEAVRTRDAEEGKA